VTLALLIANPAASQFTGGLHRTAMRILSQSYDIHAIWPQSAEHSHIAARDAARTGTDLIIAMGGDGIVHHVAQGLIGTDAVLGVIPAGTTNVLARIHQIPNRVKEATRLLAEGFDTVTSPTVEVSGAGPDGAWSARAVFSLGVGPDALVVSAAETEPYRKYRFGGVHYARTTLGVVWSDLRKRKPHVTISTPTERRGLGAMVQFHPEYTYFGRLPLRLDRDLPDPLSVMTVEKLPMRRAFSILRRAVAGNLEEVKGFRLDRRVTEFSVTADPAVDIHMDGEHYGQVTTLTAVARPDSLLIAVPQESSPPR
jgi:diacylglycerol kinase family enzyme